MPLNVTAEDDGALAAMIVLAFLEDLTHGVPVVSGPEPELAPADQRALDALGPDLAGRILEENVN